MDDELKRAIHRLALSQTPNAIMQRMRDQTAPLLAKLGATLDIKPDKGPSRFTVTLKTGYVRRFGYYDRLMTWLQKEVEWYGK